MSLPPVEHISEGIAILILMIIGFSLEKLVDAEDWLNTIPSKIRQGIFLYLTGLIVCEKKATSTKIAREVGYLSHDTLTRTLIKGKRVLGLLPILLINLCLSQTGGYLIIDDVLIPKRYSKKIQGVYNEFDHKDKERIKGMRIVMILWCNGELRIPIAWAIWHKEKKYLIGRTANGTPKYRHTGECFLQINGRAIPYKTKNQIAQELLEYVLSRGLKPEYIAIDSWYASRNNLQMITQNSFGVYLPCYSRLKSNRKVIYQGCKITVSQLDRLFSIHSFNHKHDAYIKAVNVFLPDYGDILLLLVRKDFHFERGKTKYIFSTDISASASQLLLRYRSRWAIETTFRDLKQNLNLGSCQATSLTSQESHIALAIFGFVLLELLPPLKIQGQVYSSIGEKKKLLSRIAIFSDPSRTRYWIINPSLPGETFTPLEELNLGIVKLNYNFAHETLLFPNFQKTA